MSSNGPPDNVPQNAGKAAAVEEEAPVVGTSDLSGLPWTFNPPAHPSILHKNPDIQWAYGDEASNTYGVGTDFNKLRLGRLYMGKHAMSFAAQEMGTRFGFRFLYNPETVLGGVNINGDFIPNPSVTMIAVIQEGLESFQFDLLLNRMPEVQGQASPSDYSPAITGDDMAQIRKYGTHWDLEFIYRVCNGLHTTKSNSERTGDIGILLPNPSRLQLGPFLSSGAVETIQAEDLMFNSNMIPMLTRVNIVYRRYFMTTGSTIADLQWAGKTTASSSHSSAEASGSSAPAPSTSGAGWTLAPSLAKMTEEVRAKHPKVGDIGSYRKPNGSTTEHSPVGSSGGPKYGTKGSVHALDLMINVSPESMRLLNLLIGQSRLQYLIHDRKIWSASRGWKERAYTGPGTAHTDHIHVSLANPDQARAVQYENDTSSWNL